MLDINCNQQQIHFVISPNRWVPYGKGIKTVLMFEGIIILKLRYYCINLIMTVPEWISRISALSFIGVGYLSTSENNSPGSSYLISNVCVRRYSWAAVYKNARCYFSRDTTSLKCTYAVTVFINFTWIVANE